MYYTAITLSDCCRRRHDSTMLPTHGVTNTTTRSVGGKSVTTSSTAVIKLLLHRCYFINNRKNPATFFLKYVAS